MGDDFQEALTLQEEPGVELIPTQIIPVALQNAEVSASVTSAERSELTRRSFRFQHSVTATTQPSANGC